MTDCWARTLGDCSEQSSKEHLVSAALWDGSSVDVIGFNWCRDAPKTVGINSIVSKILCKKHNNELSPLDAAAKQTFQALRESVALSVSRSAERERKWKVRRFEVEAPWLLERWFLKTAINLCAAKGGELRWRETSSIVSEPPAALVRMAFGREQICRPRGLYVAANVGETIEFRDIVSFAPLSYDGPNLVAGLFEFRGLRFVFHFESLDLPPVLSVPTRSIWSSSTLIYHLKRMNGKVGKHLSHYLEFMWQLAPRSPGV
jgi:hypothetical protein